MQCLKCGRDAKEGEAFCLDCQVTMQRYPVRPGSPVILPRREATTARKAVKRRSVSPEDQIRVLRRRTRVLTALLVAALLTAGLLAVPAWQYIFREYKRPGQNYTTVTSTAPPAACAPFDGNCFT